MFSRCLDVCERCNSLILILHVRRPSHSFDRLVALTANLGAAFRATSELHRHATLANSEL